MSGRRTLPDGRGSRVVSDSRRKNILLYVRRQADGVARYALEQSVQAQCFLLLSWLHTHSVDFLHFPFIAEK